MFGFILLLSWEALFAIALVANLQAVHHSTAKLELSVREQ
jgi:hypothetical protein